MMRNIIKHYTYKSLSVCVPICRPPFWECILCIFVLPSVQISWSHVELEDWSPGNAFCRWEGAGWSHQNETPITERFQKAAGRLWERVGFVAEARGGGAFWCWFWEIFLREIFSWGEVGWRTRAERRGQAVSEAERV